MSKVFLKDIGQISKRKKTPEGYLDVDARIARVGIQLYDAVRDFKPGELPDNIPREEGRVVKLLRPESEVFSKETLDSCRNQPITNGHPSETLSAENVRKWQVGFSRDAVRRSGDMIETDLRIQDKAAILRVENEGVNQISLGYSMEPDWTSGVDELYGAYDGVQRNIRCNHIAIVKAGRAGPEVRLSDSAQNKKGKNMATRMIDGITVEVTDQAGEVIDKLNKQLNDSRMELEKVSKMLTDEQARTERLSGELDAERQKALDTQAIDDLVNARLNLVEQAHKLAPKLETKGLSDLEIRKGAILSVNDSFELEEKSEVYVEAVFDALLKSHKPQESKLIADDLGNLHNEENPADKAREAMLAGRNQWRAN